MTRYDIRLRRDSATRWARLNPVLGEGEPGYDRTSKRFKVGDGNTPWNELEFFAPGDDPDLPGTLEEHINDPEPHPAYDDGPSFTLLYENAKV